MATDSFVKRSKLLLLTIIVFFLLSASLGQAADKTLVSPNPNDNPMLARYAKEGITLYYLGSHSGLDGWLLLKDGQVQIVYTTADKQSILVGVLYDTNGDAITEGEVKALNRTHPEIDAALQQNIIQIQQNTLMPMAGPPTGSTASLPPGEKLVQELQEASFVDLGDPKAPQLFMVIDPNCPHCQATWKALRDIVFKKNLQVHLIPVGRNDEDERAAAVLLKSVDPLNAWDKYVSGDRSQLAGNADAMILATVKTNHTLIDRWNINETPYIVYRGKDKKVKIIAGEPQNIDVLLGDLGPG